MVLQRKRSRLERCNTLYSTFEDIFAVQPPTRWRASNSRFQLVTEPESTRKPSLTIEWHIEDTTMAEPRTTTKFEDPCSFPSILEDTFRIRLRPTRMPEDSDVAISANENELAVQPQIRRSIDISPTKSFPSHVKFIYPLNPTPIPSSTSFNLISQSPTSHLSTLRNPHLHAEHSGTLLYMSPALGNASESYLRAVDTQYEHLRWQTQQERFRWEVDDDGGKRLVINQGFREEWRGAERQMEEVRRALPSRCRVLDRRFEKEERRRREEEERRKGKVETKTKEKGKMST